MSDHHYSVISISSQPGSLEITGSRRKYWVRREDGKDWLLKFPRPGTGEHWAEKVVAEIGKLLDVDTAQVELARAAGRQATLCRSFRLDEAQLNDPDAPTYMWWHGREFLDIALPDYDFHRIRDNRSHNLKNIVTAIVMVTGADGLNPMPGWDRMLEALASYAILDGLVGNTDRHHENWMVTYQESDGDVRWHAAPSFDHASSLGRELMDVRRERYLSTPTGVLEYLKKGRGGVFVNGNRRIAPSPLRLAQLLCRWNPKLGKIWSERLNSVPDAEFRCIIDRIPIEFMSVTSRDFAYRVVVTSKAELLRSIG